MITSGLILMGVSQYWDGVATGSRSFWSRWGSIWWFGAGPRAGSPRLELGFAGRAEMIHRDDMALRGE